MNVVNNHDLLAYILATGAQISVKCNISLCALIEVDGDPSAQATPRGRHSGSLPQALKQKDPRIPHC